MGWQFTAAEFVGGILMVIFIAVIFRLTLTPKLVQMAKAHAEKGIMGRMAAGYVGEFLFEALGIIPTNRNVLRSPREFNGTTQVSSISFFSSWRPSWLFDLYEQVEYLCFV